MKEIPVFYPEKTFLHQPQYEIHKGERMPHLDSPERVTQILKALREAGIADINVTDFYGMSWIEQVHDSRYLTFLAKASQNIEQLVPDSEVSPGEKRALYPSIFPYSSKCKSYGGEAEISLFAYDTYTPVMAETHKAAVDSAGCAIVAASLMAEGEKAVYALCRPPGHHALKDKMGGYCYLNNAAIAANLLLQTRDIDKVAIFDIDVHHGNGTQEIFWNEPRAFYASIHAQPREIFPYFTGYEDEKGGGKAYGTKLNFPLPKGTKNDLFLSIAEKALRAIYEYSPKVLIVSAGFDTHEADPFSFFKLTNDCYKQVGELISSLNLPTLIIQEGGYNPEILGDCVVSFLRGLIKI